MKRTLHLMTVLLTFSALAQASFMADDVQFWAGTGANQSIVIIDWNTGPQPQSLAWGFRWDNDAVAEDALRAIVTEDDRLAWKVGTPGAFGLPLYGFSYDLNDNGIIGIGADESTVASEAGDLHCNGWMTAGFWGLYIGGQDTQPIWESAMTGISGYNLVNNDWIGMSFGAAPGWNGGAPDEPVAAAVPEPMSLTLLTLGSTLLLRRRKSIC